jgi:hypothetical protein
MRHAWEPITKIQKPPRMKCSRCGMVRRWSRTTESFNYYGPKGYIGGRPGPCPGDGVIQIPNPDAPDETEPMYPDDEPSTPKAIEDESGRSLSPLSDERIARLASPADDKTDRREARAMAIEIEKLRLAYKEAIEERDTTGRCQHCPHCTGEPKASRMPYSAFAVGDVVAFVDRNPKYRIDALATRAGEPAAEMTMIRDQRGDAVLYKQLGGPASLKHAVVLPAGQFTSATQSP